MSASGFTFPPPPPPPPPQRYSDPNAQWSRGRPNPTGSTHGRGAGRGPFNHRGGPYGGSGRGHVNHYSTGVGHSQRSNILLPTSSVGPPSKRSHAAAFSSNPRSRPIAPPAVPSFNDSLASLLPPKPTPAKVPTKSALTKKTNMLGLTPARIDESDSEDDVDEEARMANAIATGGLQFEYRGQTSTLGSAAEIAAWVAERRKRWPTAAKREAAQKLAEERKLKWQEEQKKKEEALKIAKQKRLENISKASASKLQQATRASASGTGKMSGGISLIQYRAERLRRKAAKAQQRLEAAERHLLQMNNTSDERNTMEEKALEEKTPADETCSVQSDSSSLTESETSSSSESSSDDDCAPEESSSKIEVLGLSGRPRPPVRSKQCLYYTKHGYCKYGEKCKYLHDKDRVVTRDKKAKPSRPLAVRKGIWQVMVDREQEEERKRVLEAIISLGKQGVLDAPTPLAEI